MMRQRGLTAVAFLITAVVVGASALFAASAQDAAPTFEARCGRCHTLDQVARNLAGRPAATRQQFLAQFLNVHYPPPEGERAVLSALLLASAAR